MIISILTGFAAGGLHVIGGADHLVSMAPGSLRRQPLSALKGGLAWGLGHSLGVLGLSTLAIFFKDLVHIERMSSLAEFGVGITLLVVGMLAIRSSFGFSIHTHKHIHGNGHAHKHVHFHLWGEQKHNHHTHTSTSLGLLHGLAGASHLLAVIPALALPPMGAIAYMAAYLLGSILAMVVVVVAISFASSRVGKRALPLLVGFTGGLSMATGFFWLHRTSIP